MESIISELENFTFVRTVLEKSAFTIVVRTICTSVKDESLKLTLFIPAILKSLFDDFIFEKSTLSNSVSQNLWLSTESNFLLEIIIPEKSFSNMISFAIPNFDWLISFNNFSWIDLSSKIIGTDNLKISSEIIFPPNEFTWPRSE